MCSLLPVESVYATSRTPELLCVRTDDHNVVNKDMRSIQSHRALEDCTTVVEDIACGGKMLFLRRGARD